MTEENFYTEKGRSPATYKQQECRYFGGYVVEEFPLEDTARCWILYAVEATKDPGSGNFCVVKEVRADQNFTTPRGLNQYTVHANPIQYEWDDCRVQLVGSSRKRRSFAPPNR